MVIKVVDWTEKAATPQKLRKRDPLFETSLILSSARTMSGLVAMAKKYFDEGKEANEVYAEFDIPRLADFLKLNRKAAAEVLALYTDQDGESRLIASAFIALSLICVNSTDPLDAKYMLAHILEKSKHEERFRPIAKQVLITVAQMSNEISAIMGDSDPHLISFGESCLRRISSV